MSSVFSMNVLDDVKYVMKNPFGIDFEVYNNRIYIPLGSALNCIGYNDYLERIVGVARFALSLFVLGKSSNQQEKSIAAAHIFRGVLEMMGNWEKELLILDCIVTIYNIATKCWTEQKNPVMG